MNLISKFFHELWNPHCAECREQKLEDKQCVSCDILKVEVARLQILHDKLLDKVLADPEIKESEPTDLNENKPILPRSIPWNVQRKALENESRDQARILKQHSSDGKESVEELENQLGVNTSKDA